MEVELVLLLGQRLDHLLELVGVDQVAVVAEGDGAAVAGRNVGWAFSQVLAPVVE